MPAKVSNISYYLPKQSFTNKDFFELFPEAEKNNNLSKIGINNRQIIQTELASDLAINAANKLLKNITFPLMILTLLFFVHRNSITIHLLQHVLFNTN